MPRGTPPPLTDHLPFARPTLGEAEEREIIAVLRSGWIGPGPKVALFERLLQDYVGAAGVLALSSGTAALHLALLSAGAGPGTSVITTPMSWVATANAIEYTGARPVFADIEVDSMNLDPRRVEEAVTEDTRVVLPVHLGGRPADLSALGRIAQDRGLILVEDAAHALGAEYLGRKVGAISPYTCFSFHANKSITTGEGGALCVSDAGVLARARIQARCGMSTAAWGRLQEGVLAAPECIELGFKYSMSDLAAALGLAQLPRLDGFLERRTRLVALYRELLDSRFLKLPPQVQEARDAHHLLIVRVSEDSPISRDELQRRLRAHNVGTGVHYRGVHLQPYFRDKYGLKPENFPVATAYSKQVFSLPLFPSMSEVDVQTVAAIVNRILVEAPG